MKRAKNNEDNKVEYGTVSLPTPLIEKIKKRIEGTGMNSVSAYIAFIMREILSSGSSGKKEIEEVRERLKSLGY